MRNENQLRWFLAWAVHGRKPQRCADSSTGNGPPRDAAYLAWIRGMPCIACGIGDRSEAAHTGTDGGMSQKASDYSCVPLCGNCHTRATGAYHRIGKRAFEEQHGLSFVRSVEQLNEEWRQRCA